MSGAGLDVGAIAAVAAQFADPETGRSIGETGQLGAVDVEGDRVEIAVGLSTHSAPLWTESIDALTALIRGKFPQAKEVAIRLARFQHPTEPLGATGLTIKSVIAVGSGKGGVGKSTIAASLALGFHRAGAKVGLMDADIYGPSVPQLLGVPTDTPAYKVDNKVLPIMAHGIPIMSMGFLVDPAKAVVWRGPMLHGAITQFLKDTAWGELDYLVIDMPPGTGDIALTLSQMLPLTGAVVVCTPQQVALIDAVKAIAMFRLVKIPVLGMVENMSYFVCPDNGKRYDIFGHGGAQAKANELEVPFLGEVPINIAIRERGDTGTTRGNYDDESVAPYFEAICKKIVRNLAEERKQTPKLPTLPML